jgi:lysophospholipase L1-like esterase
MIALLIMSGCATVSGKESEEMTPNMERVDPSTAKMEDELLWYDMRPFGFEGQGWFDTKEPYDRFPAKAEGVVRDPVWHLSKHSAGLCVRFVTDAEEISFRWTLRNEALAMDHMPATGVSGLDLYARDGDAWRWVGVARATQPGKNQKTKALTGIPAHPHEYLLYLPLYNGVESVEIGIGPNATLEKAPARPASRLRPIVFYGTSITQGGCASRPGMAYTAILGRHFDCPVINLGFSGNGTMDLEIAKLLAELDPVAYVIDCAPNMTPEQVSERTQPFIRILREARPHTPIVLVENIEYRNAWFLAEGPRSTRKKNEALRAAYEELTTAGVCRLHYVRADKLLGPDSESTVDGVHPTDLGFTYYAKALAPVLKRVLR